MARCRAWPPATLPSEEKPIIVAMVEPPPIDDVIEIEQVLARYAVGMTRDDIDAVIEVFTPNGSYSAFGDTYALADFPALVAAAPKGLFLVGPPALELDGDTGTGQQPLCFVEQTTHDMRIGYYTDSYRRTPEGWRLHTRVDDLPAPQRRSGLGAGARPHPSPAERALSAPVTGTPLAAMDLDEFRVNLDAWLEDRHDELVPGYAGTGTLDLQMAQLSKVKQMTFDAGWMRRGWPERVGGLPGSTLLRAYLGEALTARDLVEPGLYSMTEVLAPTMIDYATPGAGRRPWSPGCCGGRRPGARVSPNLAPAATWPPCRVGPPAPIRAGRSPGRRCGPAWPSTPSAACCSPAPARPTRPTGASPRCSSTWTPRGSRCAPSRPCTAPWSSARSSSTRWSSRSSGRWATEGQGWSVAMDLLPFERSTALWHRAAYLHRRLQQLLDAAAPGDLDPVRLGEVTQLLYAFRARSRATQHRLAAGEHLGPETSIDKVLVAAAEQAVFDLAADGLATEITIGDDPASERWRTEFLYSRAATIYGGSAEIQRNIIARRLLDLGRDR